MKYLYYCIFMLVFSSCASFGIQNISKQAALENHPYTIQIKAWEKNLSTLSVQFFYRINNAPWKKVAGNFNGTFFEVYLSPQEVVAGSLEFYGEMHNAKGETIKTNTRVIGILSFEQAKKQQEKEYFIRLSEVLSLSEVLTEPEFFYNESVILQMNIQKTNNLQKVQCAITANAQTIIYDAQAMGDDNYQIIITPPHPSFSYTYQWQVFWYDDTFGEMLTSFPIIAKKLPIYDQTVLKERIESNFKKVITIKSQHVLEKEKILEVQIQQQYNSLLNRFSLKQQQTILVLRKPNGFVKLYKVSEKYPDSMIFFASIPLEDLESGGESFSIQYSDFFESIGTIQNEFPSNGYIAINATGLLQKLSHEQ